MENPIKMDDLGVPPFKETPICSNSATGSLMPTNFTWPDRDASCTTWLLQKLWNFSRDFPEI